MNYPAASSGVSKNLNSVIPHLMRNPETKVKRLSNFLLVPDTTLWILVFTGMTSTAIQHRVSPRRKRTGYLKNKCVFIKKGQHVRSKSPPYQPQ
jgi:hypothetical protein